MLEGLELEGEEKVVLDVSNEPKMGEVQEPIEEVELLGISLHAISGKLSSQTMRLWGVIENQ